MKRITVLLAALLISAAAQAQQPQRPSDQEIDARSQVWSNRLAMESARSVVLEARVIVLEQELAKAREELAKVAPKPEAKK